MIVSTSPAMLMLSYQLSLLPLLKFAKPVFQLAPNA